MFVDGVADGVGCTLLGAGLSSSESMYDGCGCCGVAVTEGALVAVADAALVERLAPENPAQTTFLATTTSPIIKYCTY